MSSPDPGNIVAQIQSYVAGFSLPAAAIAVALYFSGIPVFVWRYYTAPSRWGLRILLAEVIFCSVRCAAFVCRCLLPQFQSFQLYQSFYALLMSGTASLLAVLAEVTIAWCHKVDDSVLAFSGRDGLGWSRTFLAFLGWVHVLAIVTVVTWAGYGAANAVLLINPYSAPEARASWRRPGYYLFEFGVWIGVMVVIVSGVVRLYTGGKGAVSSHKSMELDPHTRSSWVSHGSGDGTSSNGELAFAARSDAFFGKAKLLNKALYGLLVPCAILSLVRMAFAPFVVTEEQFGDIKVSEGLWYPVVVGSEIIFLIILALPHHLKFLEIEGLRLRPLQQRRTQ
ncbi:hypothetical protein M427DRAFT_158291 [Gonapodya prolifera JEL478]|uniref:RTA1-domain-containing protein n=1 Tax=Gonapodya prolifera (strain JEL478) TaxID=1344416 RepID=A0A139A437_GONPJ|nr:hypothetical protein M427DRAFT_158291 [Gonapodya prolifera JEL478]|eukprot:KXS11235.1 hypothetical protein M427DRAFT_158291 [Gonapodya prolifera JEL478]